MTPPTIGKTGSKPVEIDVGRLITSRLLLTATSGLGKSWALRRLLEQSFGHAQHLVIDTEGEFYTLRERFDYVLAAADGTGDCPAHPEAASMLARKLLELGHSAIIDIYELEEADRQLFVERFLRALVNAPRTLWHPALVVVDEAHEFCPEGKKGAAGEAVSALMTKGRKRGFAGILATQRLANLRKTAAAMCRSRMVGGVVLKHDVLEAQSALDFDPSQARELKRLDPGDFYVYGPAFEGAREPTLVNVGPVQTTHPEAGQKAPAVPAPRAAVEKALGELVDLPEKARQEAETLAEAQAEIQTLRRELRAAEKAPAPASEEDLARARQEGAEEVTTRLHRLAAQVDQRTRALDDQLAAAQEHLERFDLHWRTADEIRAQHALDLEKIRLEISAPIDVELEASPPPPRPAVPPGGRPTSERMLPRQEAADPASREELDGPARRVLDALAELETLRASTPRRELVALLAGYRHPNSKGFTNALGALRSRGLIDYPRGGELALEEGGRALAQAPAAPASSAEIQERVVSLLGGTSERILRPLVAAYPDGLSREALCQEAGYQHTHSKGFTNALGKLRTLGFLDYPEPGYVKATEVLFL